jgi:hypothetical protein
MSISLLHLWGTKHKIVSFFFYLCYYILFLKLDSCFRDVRSFRTAHCFWLRFRWRSLMYLILSSNFAIGLHPLGARWIAEHYAMEPKQVEFFFLIIHFLFSSYIQIISLSLSLSLSLSAFITHTLFRKNEHLICVCCYD